MYRWLVIPIALTFGCAHSDRSVATTGNQPYVVENIQVHLQQPPPVQTSSAASCPATTVHFAVNSDELTPSDQAALDQAAACLKEEPQAKVTVEGSADERGPDDHNMALGHARAEAVSNYLQEQGASPAQIETSSSGDTKPVCDEHDESCWKRNRTAAIAPVRHPM